MNGITPVLNQIWEDLASPFWFESNKGAADIAPSFPYLYQSAVSVLSLSLGIHKFFNSMKEESAPVEGESISEREVREKKETVRSIAAAVFELGCNRVSPVGGAILSSGTLLGKHVIHMKGHLSKNDWRQFRGEFFGAMIVSVRLFAIFSGSTASIIASIALQSFSELCESYRFSQNKQRFEMLNCLALAAVRASIAAPYISKSLAPVLSRV